MSYRVEKDFLGEKKISAGVYWGIHTERARENFPISGYKMNPKLIKALATVKKACCQANEELGYLEKKKAGAIRQACDEILEGKFGDLKIDVFSGRDYPENLKEYRLIVHCGGCMLTRREMLARIHRAKEVKVPITNYGVAISFSQGVVQRVLTPFPAALDALQQELRKAKGSRLKGKVKAKVKD